MRTNRDWVFTGRPARLVASIGHQIAPEAVRDGLAPQTSWFGGGGRPAKQAFCAQVFVDVRPVNPLARSAYLPARSLFHDSVQESRIPR